jgi:hypothetical protein
MSGRDDRDVLMLKEQACRQARCGGVANDSWTSR